MGLGVVGLEAQGLPIAGHRLVEPALPGQDVAQVVVGFGIVGLEAEGLPIAGHGLVQLALLVQGIPRLLWASG